VPQVQAKNPLFDIIIEDEVNIQNYCNALIAKILKLDQSQFPDFIDYQFNQVKNPEVWICKLEKLLANNEAFFSSKTALSRYNKLYILIDKKRTELQSSCVKAPITKTPKRLINAESEDRYFSFHEVKQHIEKIESFGEKIIYLADEVFEYKQADIISINNKLQAYDAQCNHLMEKLQTMRKMRAELEKEQKELITNQSHFNKLKFNGNVNQLVDVFYQLNRELFVDGKSYIDGTSNDIISLIVNSFIDKDGNEISPQTIETILKPSRTDKRPKPHKRLDVDKML
jgi:DNA repair ATPase RecN